jgi:ketosteroid isomerase-like protein
VPATPREIFERYLWAGAITRNADALAEMFAEDGVLEAPLVPPGHAYPRRLEGREEIRRGIAAYHRRSSSPEGKANAERSRSVLHTTADPDVFIAEIDAVMEVAGGTRTISLVQIFRIADGKITLMRDYFAPDEVA